MKQKKNSMKLKNIILLHTVFLSILLSGCSSGLQTQITSLQEENETLRSQLLEAQLDKTPPVITLSESEVSLSEGELIDFHALAKAFDNRDGDVTSKIVIDTNGFDKDVAGTYTIYFVVTDNCDNQAKMPLTITITAPPPSQRIDADLRNAKWRDDINTIKKYETADLLYEDTLNLSYSTKISNSDAHVIYKFSEEFGLYRAIYAFKETHTSVHVYITDYKRYKDALTEKYGSPYEDDIIKTSSLADYTDESGALQLGYVIYRTRWKTDTTDIMMGMWSDNGETQTLVSFTSKDYDMPTDTSNW